MANELTTAMRRGSYLPAAELELDRMTPRELIKRARELSTLARRAIDWAGAHLASEPVSGARNEEIRQLRVVDTDLVRIDYFLAQVYEADERRTA